jgi:hypothetical protein
MELLRVYTVWIEKGKKKEHQVINKSKSLPSLLVD